MGHRNCRHIDIVGLAMQGKKVLLIDADPQGDLTTCLGWRDTDNLGITLATKLTDVISETMNDPTDGILHHEEGVDLLPANLELSAMEYNLMNAMSRETTLRNYLSQVKDRYDFVLIDCMPSLSMVTLNALSAADSVIIPVQAQYLPAKGMTQLVQTISKVKKYINQDIKIDGMLLTLVDNRTNLAKSTVEALRENFGNQIKLYRTSIPIAVKAAETSSKGKSIFAYEPNSTVSKACRTVPIWDRKWHCCCRKPFGFWNIWHCDGETGTCSGLPVILCLVEKL
jgi:chromosome partitioning protein